MKLDVIKPWGSGVTQGYEGLRHRIQVIAATDSPEKTFQTLIKCTDHYDFNLRFAGRLGGQISGDGGVPQFFFAEVPKDWREIYVNKGYSHIDPVSQMAMRITRPFRWAECYVDLTPAQQAFVDHSKSYGLNYGITFPMKHAKGMPGTVSFGSDRDFKLTSEEKIELEILGRHAFERIEELMGTPGEIANITLSAREHDILTLVAQGKTNWEIGAILDLSEYSVRDYLKDISKRMQTSNRTHTVTRAIQLGLILP